MYFRTQAAIDTDAILYNVHQTKQKLPQGVKLLAVIKADAYGHGAVGVARLLQEECDFFGVACVDEAMELINAGIQVPLLILGHVAPEEFTPVVRHDIRLPIFSLEDAKALSAEAQRQNKTAKFHFCVDTGMSRIGFQVTEESADICRAITQLPHIEAEGLFSHFATADEADLNKALQQQARFETFIALLEARDVTVAIKHINNSAGIMNFDKCFDMCRMGIITYGLYPSEEVDKARLSLKPALRWLTHISHIKTLEKGREISYGGDYITPCEKTIATIPVGYADGYPRCLSGKGSVLIHGKEAPILGRVCMDQFMVDISHIPAAVGDEVVLIGDTLSMEAVSAAAHSFNYELPCRISRRVPRVYYQNGKATSVTKHL